MTQTANNYGTVLFELGITKEIVEKTKEIFELTSELPRVLNCPDLSPKNNEIAKNNHYDSRYRYPLGGMATIRRYSQPTGADTFTSSTRTDTLRMARLR